MADKYLDKQALELETLDEGDLESETTVDTEDTEGDTTETEDTETFTTKTYDTSTTEETSESESVSSSVSELSESSLDEEKSTYLLPHEILALEGRRIKAEDFEWGLSPVPTLADTIIQAANIVEGPDLENLLKHASNEQKECLYEMLSLDLPLNITLTLIGEGNYWKRMCLRSWRCSDIWRYSGNWKAMFVHRTVQKLIENFSPEKSDFSELIETLKIFSPYVNSLQIEKLQKITEKNLVVNLSSEDFDEQLDDYIAKPQGAIYLDFEKILECFLHIKELVIILSPRSLDYEEFQLNVADFNSMFRGLRKLNNLQKMRISNGSFSNEQIGIVLRMFLTHSCLTTLNLSYNFIDNDLCDYIGKLLLSDCPLETLILKYNNIMDEGAKSIAAALSVNSKLKKLDLSLNMIQDEGGSFFAHVLMKNLSIVDLDVSKNKMLSKAGVAFAKLLRSSSNLRSLKIEENLLGEVAGKMFSNAMEKNTTILELDVHFCGFNHDDIGIIHHYLIRNRSEVNYHSYVCNKNNVTAAEFVF